MASEINLKPRIGVPFRTKKEQLAGDRKNIARYIDAVHMGGAQAVEVPLDLAPAELKKLAETLDGIALSGSPADVDPVLFHAATHPKTAAADRDRERTDFALIEHCFAEKKPILAICYGIQSLNVFLGGSLLQDIPSEVPAAIQHDVKSDRGPETYHSVVLEPGSRLAKLAHDSAEARVNSSHHQSALAPGRGLRITARASDGVIEALEGTAHNHWVTAVQWHPERMVDEDAFARSIFRALTAAARKAPVQA
jgi:putative glutamine amidotransferase